MIKKTEPESTKTDKARNWHHIKHAITEWLLGAAVCVGVVGLVFLDIIVLGQRAGEDSFIEAGQVVIYFLSSIIFYNTGIKNRAISGGLHLIGGLLMCMAIRELDWLTDLFWHGSWKYPAYAAAAFSIFAAVRVKETILPGLEWFSKSRSSVYMMTGLLCVMIFSRLFGSGKIWFTLYDRTAIRIVKNAMEEGLELYGACYIFIAAVMVLRQSRHERKRALLSGIG